MSGSISTAATLSSYGLLGRIVDDSATVRRRLDTLTQQSADGKIADTYAGLGAGARVSLTLSPVIAHQQAQQNGIDTATSRMTVTQTAMTSIQQVASDFYAKLDTLTGLNATNVDSVAASARDALKQVAGLLDSKIGDVYVFAGQDSATAPIANPDNILSSGFYTQIASAIGALSANGATATADATLATASSNAVGTSPFSASQSQSQAAVVAQRAAVSVGDGQTVSYGLTASSNVSATSTGSSTTGSYMRDLMRSLATLGSLNSSQVDTAGQFQSLISDTRSSLSGAISAMAVDAGAQGDAQTNLASIKSRLSDMQTALKTQVSGVEDVDMATTLSDLSLTQTQLQSSYQLIASVSSLSLVKYLASG